MNIYCENDNLIIESVDDFDISEILECGQCFHFTKIADMEYELINYNKYLHVKQDGKKVLLYDTDIDAYNNIWSQYFDMETDYAAIKKQIISIDGRLLQSVNSKNGIRILKQNFFETLISFIISQNKQIPHIKQIVHNISEKFGDEISLKDGRKVYSFPDAKRLNSVNEDEIRACKVGFRAPYIMDACDKVSTGQIREEKLREMSYKDAKECLMSIKGVGEKVANCVLLFSLGKTDAFPVDVWMKRIMEAMYFGKDTKKEVIEKFAYERFGSLSGYAQQYLFCYGREIGLGK